MLAWLEHRGCVRFEGNEVRVTAAALTAPQPSAALVGGGRVGRRRRCSAAPVRLWMCRPV